MLDKNPAQAEVPGMKKASMSKGDIATMSVADVAELAARLERDDYANVFEGLEDWHLLRAIAFQRPELVEPYIHLLDLEAYDEA
jgi:DUF971 family protein